MKRATSEQARRPGMVGNVFAIVSTVWTGCFAIGFGAALPRFAELFAAFGTDLPRLTQVVLNARILVSTLLILGFLLQLGLFIRLLSTKTFAARRLTLTTAAVNIVAQLVLIAAIYGPIIKMGTVI